MPLLYYTRQVTAPRTKREGLANAVQMAINELERGDHTEALMRLVDLLDDIRSKSNPYELGRR